MSRGGICLENRQKKTGMLSPGLNLKIRFKE